MATQRVRIGELLRDWRERRRLTQEQLGELVSCSQSKIAKIEGGDCGLKYVDLDTIVGALELPAEVAAELREMNGVNSSLRLRDEHRATTSPTWFRDMPAFERDATRIRSWTGERISGLLHAEGYMLAQYTAYGYDNVDEPMQDRWERQKVFDLNPRCRFEFLLSESAIDRLVHSLCPHIAADQLTHMLWLIDNYDTVTIRLVPYLAIVYVDPDYTILEFEPGTRDFVYTENLHNSPRAYAEDLLCYERSWDALAEAAMDPARTREVLADRRSPLTD
ncbi:helix-turn-helix domain-containing protein [Amycolatopsis aidingensis]|uniref:helix-turn-helix domain-containing protein n=1 Tax=Amycolatopsis aidingensis TaxID=2842453 RepID=UPI001C0CDEF3|nr:helix-turn-helix transcriptional regulator [Amycolatopsis aidingensis]